MNPKISVITVCLNSEKTIERSIQSLLSQTYTEIEYIVIDGGSNDKTKDILETYKEDIDILISEKDNGLYDGLNKGIGMSTGDIIGILHSDDIFEHKDVLSKIAKTMSDSKTDMCFSDTLIVDSEDRITRFYSSKYFNRYLLRIGWMPSHPATFIKRSVFEKFGNYSLHYSVASDFDFFLRVFKGNDINWKYLDDITVRMSTGGSSNQGLQSKILILREIKQSLKNHGYLSLYVIQLFRYLIRLFELINRPSKKHANR